MARKILISWIYCSHIFKLNIFLDNDKDNLLRSRLTLCMNKIQKINLKYNNILAR